MKLLAKSVFAVLVFASFPAFSAEFDPFYSDSGEWMSLEHYSDKLERFPSLFPQKEPDPPPPVQIEAKAEEEQTVMPIRQLNLPAMPGVNKDYGILVSSTAEDEPVLAQPSRPLNLPVFPGVTQRSYAATNEDNSEELNNSDEQTILKLAGSLWQDAKSAAKQTKSRKAALNIRLANLPNSSIAPIPPNPATKKRAAPVNFASVPNIETPAASSIRNPEICAAVTEHKKRQLAAIESDRQTLNALQAAIAELGLSKELDFMSGTKGGLNIQANADSIQTDINVPAGDVAISSPNAKN